MEQPPLPPMIPLSIEKVDKMVAEAMTWRRERRHIPRQDLEREKMARELVTSILQVQ